MDVKEIISKELMQEALSSINFNRSVEEGYLMLTELIIKASAGYYNSHTEELFLKEFNLLRADRIPTANGRKFLCAMLYASSNNKSTFVQSSNVFRK